MTTPDTAATVRERAICIVAGVLAEAPTATMTRQDFDRLAEVIVARLQQDGWTYG